MTPQHRDDQELERRLLRYSTAAGLTLAAGLALPAQPAHAARVWIDVDLDVQVARWAAVAARPAPALEADPLSVLDAGRDADLDLPRPPLHARSTARPARVVDHSAPPAARGTGPTEREEPLIVVLDPRALTGRTPPRRAPGLCAGARAGRARRVAGEVDGRGEPVDGVVEVEM